MVDAWPNLAKVGTTSADVWDKVHSEFERSGAEFDQIRPRLGLQSDNFGQIEAEFDGSSSTNFGRSTRDILADVDQTLGQARSMLGNIAPEPTECGPLSAEGVEVGHTLHDPDTIETRRGGKDDYL